MIFLFYYEEGDSHICKVTIICVNPVLSVHEDTFADCDMHSVDKCSVFLI